MPSETLREFSIRDIVSVRRPKVVAIGGGTGLNSILRGLKKYSENLTAIVTMGDDGGSSGRLRENLGLLPPGDIRNCILALADDEDMMQKLFNYRFESGELKGHNFGNLFLAAMDGISGDFFEAVRKTSDVLDIKGEVLPVTLDPMTLEARLEDGTLVRGESEIPKVASERGSRIDTLFLETTECVKPLEETIRAIKSADIIIIGPGSLYTSLISNLLIPGIVEAINKSVARKYYIANLMTQPGETDNFTQREHLMAIEKYTGENIFDAIVLNTGEIESDVASVYEKGGQKQVVFDGVEDVEVVSGNFITVDSLKKVRHDADRLAEALFRDYLKRYRNKN